MTTERGDAVGIARGSQQQAATTRRREAAVSHQIWPGAGCGAVKIPLHTLKSPDDVTNAHHERYVHPDRLRGCGFAGECWAVAKYVGGGLGDMGWGALR